MTGFFTVIGITIILEIANCMFPRYAENIWTETANGYHENTGCICSWEKEDFVYNEETGKWDLATAASRKRGKGPRGRKRGGCGLR